MSRLQFRAGEMQRAQQFARLCEAHLRYAAGCKDAGQTGAQLIHQQLARDYSHAAFALVARVAARSRA